MREQRPVYSNSEIERRRGQGSRTYENEQISHGWNQVSRNHRYCDQNGSGRNTRERKEQQRFDLNNSEKRRVEDQNGSGRNATETKEQQRFDSNIRETERIEDLNTVLLRFMKEEMEKGFAELRKEMGLQKQKARSQDDERNFRNEPD